MRHGGFSAHTPSIHDHAKKTGQRADDVAQVGKGVSGAGLSGGGLGQVGSSTAGAHQNMVNRVQSSLGRSGDRLRGQSDRLHQTGRTFTDTDEEHASRLNNISTKGQRLPGAAASAPTGRGARGRSGPRIGSQNRNLYENDTPTANRPACGDPIDISTGRVMITQIDVVLDGVLQLVLSRTHLSNYALGRSFGPSWACTLDQRVEVESDAVHFAVEDGTLLRYPLPGPDGVVLPESGPRWSLSRENDGFVIVDPQANRALVFAPATGDEFALAAIVGPGQHIEIQRDATGTPVQLRHSAGHRVAVDSADGLVTGLRLLPPNEDCPEVTLAGYSYDDQRRLTEVRNSFETPLRYAYDASNRVVRWDDRNGMWYQYEFDGQSRCVRADGAEGYQNYTFDYDRENLVTRATDSLGHTTVYELDEALRVAREINALGHTTVSEWDPFDRLLSRTDPLGGTTRFEYDDAGNLVATTWPDGSRELLEYNAMGQPVTVIDPDGAVWRREYDDAGRITTLVDPTGARTGYRYHEAGDLAAITDPLGGLTLFESNALGLPTAVTDPLGGVTRYDYDMFGRPVLITDPLGEVTELTWTPEGLPLTETSPDGTTEYRLHDGEGNATVMVDAHGQLTSTEFAHFDLPVAQVGADGGRLEYRYDTELRLVAVTNQQGQQWRYEYDAAGNLVRENDFTGREIRYAYDAAGRLVERVNGAGQVVRMERDALGRTVRQIADGAVTTFEYDPAGRIIRARNTDAEITVTYDPAGRVLTETVNGRTVHSRYDGAGRRIGRRTPTGASATWEFDAADQPIALHTAGQTVRFGYDAAGRETQRQFGAGVTVAQQWDPAHRLREQALFTNGQPAPAQRRTYSYREDGVLAELTDQLSGPRRFDLDPNGRITAVHRENGDERYTYDPAGNLVHADLPGTPDTGDREYVGGLLVRAGAVYYAYDADCRVVSRQWRDQHGATHGWQYRWDAEDRLVQASTPDGQRWRYRYDPLGRRTAKQRLGDGDEVLEQVEFCWDGDNIAEQVRNGRTALVWDWEPGGFTAVGQTERAIGQDSTQWTDRAFHAIVADQVGTPRELVSPDGAEIWHLDTTLWGQPRSAAGARTPLRFPGQFHDEETGLYYNFHRHYDPATASYASTDPLGLAPAPNARAYVPNPTGWTDPLGLSCRSGQSSRRRRTSAQRPGGSSRRRPGRTSAGSSSNTAAGGGPSYATGRFSGPSQQALSGTRVPAYDGTHGGLYPPQSYAQYAGSHRHTNQYSTGNLHQSEHVIPSRASNLAGIQGYSERYEPTMSIPTRYHQPASDAAGLGGGTVSSTGSGHVPDGWGRQVAAGIRPSAQHPSGYSYYDGLRMTAADEMNVHPDSASGLHSVVNGHHSLGRLTDDERNQLHSTIADRYWRHQEGRYGR